MVRVRKKKLVAEGGNRSRVGTVTVARRGRRKAGRGLLTGARAQPLVTVPEEGMAVGATVIW